MILRIFMMRAYVSRMIRDFRRRKIYVPDDIDKDYAWIDSPERSPRAPGRNDDVIQLMDDWDED